MEEEHITRDPSGTHTTIVTDGDSRRGSGSGWFIVLVLLIAIVVGIYFFTQMSGSEAAKDNAVANAANQVGNAATQVGDAAQDAAGSVNNNR